MFCGCSAQMEDENTKSSFVNAIGQVYGANTAERIAFHRRVIAGTERYRGSSRSNKSQGELLCWAANRCPTFTVKHPKVA